MEYRYPFALISVNCNCFNTEQKKEISVPICRISNPAEATVDATSNRKMASFAAAPVTLMMLAKVAISAMEAQVSTRNLFSAEAHLSILIEMLFGTKEE